MNALPAEVPNKVDGPKRREINQSIQGLRGFAALLVVFYHVHAMSVKGTLVPETSSRLWAPVISGLGPFGVVLFFFISGYLILQTLVKHGDIRHFLLNRCIRIYPVFLVLTIPMFALGPMAHYEWMGRLLGHPLRFIVALTENVLFLPGIFPPPIAQKNAWSLSYEFAFYLLACVFYAGSKIRENHKVRKGAILSIAIVLTTAAILYRNLAGFFLVGVAAYLFELRRMDVFKKAAAALGPFGPVLLVLAFACFVKSMIACAIAGFLFFLPIVAERGPASRLLRTRALVFVGKISYSLYLIHPFVFDPLRIVLVHLHQKIHNGLVLEAVFYVIGVPLAIAAATLSYDLIEDRFTNKYLRPKRRTIPT